MCLCVHVNVHVDVFICMHTSMFVCSMYVYVCGSVCIHKQNETLILFLSYLTINIKYTSFDVTCML